MTCAIDIALLLDEPTQAIVRRLNADTAPAGDDGFRFDGAHHPHVTLGQHFVDDAALDDITGAVAPLAAQAALALDVTGVERGRTAQSLTITSTEPLDRLHLSVMAALAPFEQAGDAAAFAPRGIAARPADVAWVREFRSASAFARFHPHITLGIGGPPLTVPPFVARPSALAVCRLGRFCTCGEVLASWPLPR